MAQVGHIADVATGRGKWQRPSPSVVSRQSSVVSRQSSVVSRQPSAVSRQPSAVSHQNFVSNRSIVDFYFLSLVKVRSPTSPD
jgi:hypothetical protein